MNRQRSDIPYAILDSQAPPAEPDTSALEKSNDSPQNISFYLTDHLGNTRVNFRAGAGGTIEVLYAADYFPFGKVLREYKPCEANRFLSTQHERDEVTGYDNRGARLYDSELGRFLGVDPLANIYPSWSPYNYVLGNPISLIDPDGRSVESTHVDEVGNVIAEYDDGDNGVYVHGNGTSKDDVDNQRQGGLYTGGEGNYIGELGGILDLGQDGIFVNKLVESANQTLSEDFTFGQWMTNVKGGGDWDLKANKKTIFGVAWAYDQANGTSTGFSTPNLQFQDASDVGNYHAGFTGSMFGIRVPWQKFGAGAVEQYKDLTQGNFLQVANQYTSAYTLPNSFMDEADDHYWNTQGMSDAKYLKEKLNLSSTRPLGVQRQ